MSAAGGPTPRPEGCAVRLAWLLHLGLAAAALVAYLSPYVAPGALWPVAFAALAYPSTLLALVLVGGFWVYRGRPRRALVSVAVVALGYGHLRELVGFGGPGGEGVAFATYNLLGGRAFADLDDEALASRAAELAACLGADVVALQESPRYARIADAIDSAFAAAGLAYAYRPGGPYLTLHSRFPLRDRRVVEAYNELNGVLRADVLAGGGDTVRVLAAHLESNRVRLDAGQVARDVAQADPRAYRTLRGVAANYRLGARRRGAQAAALAAEARASPYPVVVLGDLNDVPLSYALGTLRRAGLADAFREAGRGFGVTYEGSVPGLRIDYVLASEELAPLRASVLACDFSDHRPTRATLATPGGS